MSLIQAIILGIVQGLTEFIPISSTAHLIFAGRAVGLYAGVNAAMRAEQTTATIAVLQLGTLLAVLVYFASDIWSISRAFLLDHLALISGRQHLMQDEDGSIYGKLSRDAWLGWLIVIGSIPIAVVGLLFKKQIEGTFTKNLWVIATMMIVIGRFEGNWACAGTHGRTSADNTAASRSRIFFTSRAYLVEACLLVTGPCNVQQSDFAEQSPLGATSNA